MIDNTRRSTLRLQDLRRIAAQWLRRELDKHYIRRAYEFGLDDSELEIEAEVYRQEADYWSRCVQVRDYQRVEAVAHALQQEHSLTLDEGQNLVFHRTLTQAHSELYDRLASHAFPSLLEVPLSPGEHPEPVTSPPTGPLLSELFELYAEQKQRVKAWSTKRSANENRHAFSVLLELVGDMPATAFTNEHVRILRAEHPKYPKDRTKGANKGLTIEQLAERGVETISPTTVSNQFNKWTAFFGWMQQEQYIATNLLAGRSPTRGVKLRSDRRKWEPEELRTLFKSPEYMGGEYHGSTTRAAIPAYYWVPLIGLYTGARLEEICQLLQTDIRCDDGIRYFHIRNYADVEHEQSKRVKSEAGKRKVPIHAHLIDLGLLEYVGQRSGHERLFELPYVAESYGHKVGKWFQRYRKRQGLSGKQTTVFHSFRNTMVDALSRADVEDARIMAIVGHEPGTTTRKVYAREFPLEILNAAVQKVDWREELAMVRSWTELGLR